jgi:c-di-GMP-binding flagellar brake protein YcgR
MKTSTTLQHYIIVAIAGILFFCHNPAAAQTEAAVIAISKDGISHRAPTSLKVAVIPCTDPLKFKVSLENLSDGYVKVMMRDNVGNVILKRFKFEEKKAVMNLDMSKLEEGTYTVEVANESEQHSYKIVLGKKEVRTLEIKPGILATLPR